MATTIKAPTATPTVLYDRDCGFCRWSLAKILAWDRRRRLFPLPIQSEEGQRMLAGVPEEERLRSWHLVEPDGKVSSGGAAFPGVFRLLPGGAPFAALTARLPRLTEAAYRLVARNRVPFGRPLTRGMKERATARIDERGPEGADFGTGASCELPPS